MDIKRLISIYYLRVEASKHIYKKEEIAKFIKERLDYQYIPCVRTADLSAEVVEKLSSPGMNYSEIEDLVDLKHYRDIFTEKYNVDLDTDVFRKLKHPWSERVKREFISQGAIWSDEIEIDTKMAIAGLVEEMGFDAFHPAKIKVLEALVKTLARRTQAIV